MVRTKISTTFSVTSMYGITNPPQFEMSQNVAHLPVPQIEITQNTARRRWMFFLIQTAYKASYRKIIGIKPYLFENFCQKKGSRKF